MYIDSFYPQFLKQYHFQLGSVMMNVYAAPSLLIVSCVELHTEATPPTPQHTCPSSEAKMDDKMAELRLPGRRVSDALVANILFYPQKFKTNQK